MVPTFVIELIQSPAFAVPNPTRIYSNLPIAPADPARLPIAPAEVAGTGRIRWNLPACSHGSGDFGVWHALGLGAPSAARTGIAETMEA